MLAKKAKAALSGMIDERRSLRRLRQDLERVRLLCELIRKREQRKRDLIVNKAQVNELQCFPLIYFMRRVSTKHDTSSERGSLHISPILPTDLSI